MHVKVDDMVKILTGSDKGQTGKVLVVDHSKRKVVVEGINKVFKHVRRSQKNPQGGRLSKEMPIDASNVMVICPQTNEPTRVGTRIAADGSKERFAKKSGASMGMISPPKTKAAK